MLEPRFSSFNVLQDFLEGLLKAMGSTPRVSELVGMQKGICIPQSSQGRLLLLVWGWHSENHCVHGRGAHQRLKQGTYAAQLQSLFFMEGSSRENLVPPILLRQKQSPSHFGHYCHFH